MNAHAGHIRAQDEGGQRSPHGESPILLRRPDIEGRFDTMIWDLTETDHHSGRVESICRIDWNDVAANHPGWLAICKELCWHRLNTPLATQKTIGSYHASREQLRMKRFLRWLDVKHPDVAGPLDLRQRHVHEYRVWLENHGPEDAVNASGANVRTGSSCSPQTVWSYLLPIKALDVFRERLNSPLPFSPYDGNLTAKMLGAGEANEENATEPLPDEVIATLIDCARRYIEHYAPTVLAMREEMHEFWDDGRADFPGWKTSPGTCPETGITWMPDRKKAAHHLYREELGHLVAACLIVILYLSGMRSGEASNLGSDCLDRPVDRATGLRDRWRISGIPLKKRGKGKEGKPPPVEWVVPDIVAQAVQMLQKLLAPYRAMHGSDLLMLSKDALRKPKSRDRKLLRSSKTGYPLSVTSIGSLINLFYERARWQRDAIAQTDPSLTQAPDYHIKPSQFRRTLARFIARQPFGIIAGRLQYHHVSTAVFEGYAGSTSDTFALDVEDERILAGIDILEEMRSDARAGWRAGPGASRVLAEWENVREVGLASAVVDTSSKGAVLDNSVRKLVQTVHVGSLSYCVFNVSNALCLTEQEKSSPGASPAISMCSPDKCANSVIAPCHVPKWQGLLDEVRRLSGTARSGPQKQSLRTAAERYEGVIAKAQGGGNGKD